MEKTILLLLIFCNISFQVGNNDNEVICDDFMSFEQPNIDIELLNNASLFAKRKSTHSVILSVTNHYYEDLNYLLVSHRENFYKNEKHVELVKETFPKEIKNLAANQTEFVEIQFQIPSYVDLGLQSKVTLQVEKYGLTPDDRQMTEKSFYFMVVDKDLKHYDNQPPQCGQMSLCKTACEKVNDIDTFCNETLWTGEIQIWDNKTGLRSIELVNEISTEENFNDNNDKIDLTTELFTLGTQYEVSARFSANCCNKGFDLRVTDVAGNYHNCHIGESSSPSSISFQFSLGSFCLITVLAMLV